MLRYLCSLSLAILLAAPLARAGDPRSIQVDLELGPVIGGQDLIASLRSTEADALGLLFMSFDGTPTLLGNHWPAFSLNLAGASILTIVTDANGRLFSSSPTAPGDFGAAGVGVTFYVQALLLSQTGQRLASNREALEVEPLNPGQNWLTDVSAARLPTGYDDIESFSATSGDFNRDGIPDLAITGLEDSSGLEFLELWINDGTGHFSDETAARIPGFPQGSLIGLVQAADLSGDNRADLLVTGFDDGVDVPDTLWVDDGTGLFVQNLGFDGGAFLTGAVTPGDFDNDGRIDLVRVQAESSANPGVLPADALSLHSASGWVPHSAFALAAWNDPLIDVSVYAPGDVDNDGDLDLFAARFGFTNMLLLNDGSGGFADASLTSLEDSTGAAGSKLDDSLGAALVDLDMDGWLDVVVHNTYFSFDPVYSGDLYFNDGTGLLQENNTSDVETVLFDDGFRITLDVGDLDADGDPDVYFGGHDLFAGANHVLLINDGGVQGGSLGTLSRQNWFEAGDYITADVELFDMDTDGDLDLLQLSAGVVTGSGPDGLVVYLFENSVL